MAFADALNDYQNWTATTAVYPEALTMPYLGLGLGDEAAELVEKMQMMTLEGRSVGWGIANVLPEAGDVMWYLAQLLLHRGHSLGRVYEQAMALEVEYQASLTLVVTEVTIACGGLQGRLKKELRDGQVDEARILHYAARVLRALDSIARWYGSNLILVMHQNRSKLSDRLERNVIKGEGDAR